MAAIIGGLIWFALFLGYALFVVGSKARRRAAQIAKMEVGRAQLLAEIEVYKRERQRDRSPATPLSPYTRDRLDSLLASVERRFQRHADRLPIVTGADLSKREVAMRKVREVHAMRPEVRKATQPDSYGCWTPETPSPDALKAIKRGEMWQ